MQEFKEFEERLECKRRGRRAVKSEKLVPVRAGVPASIQVARLQIGTAADRPVWVSDTDSRLPTPFTFHLSLFTSPIALPRVRTNRDP